MTVASQRKTVTQPIAGSIDSKNQAQNDKNPENQKQHLRSQSETFPNAHTNPNSLTEQIHSTNTPHNHHTNLLHSSSIKSYDSQKTITNSVITSDTSDTIKGDHTPDNLDLISEIDHELEKNEISLKDSDVEEDVDLKADQEVSSNPELDPNPEETQSHEFIIEEITQENLDKLQAENVQNLASKTSSSRVHLNLYDSEEENISHWLGYFKILGAFKILDFSDSLKGARFNLSIKRKG